MKAAMRLKKPSAIKAPAASSMMPAAIIRGGRGPATIGAGKPTSFIRPCSRNSKPTMMRRTPRICGEYLLRKPMRQSSQFLLLWEDYSPVRLMPQAGQVLLEPMNRIVAVDDVGLAHQFLEQRNGGLDAVHHQLVQGAAQAQQALVAILGMDDQFARQAVVIVREFVAGIDRAVEAHAQAARRVKLGDQAGRGAEGEGIFRIDAAFDGMALEHDVLLGEAQRRAGGDADLLAHDVDASDGFADGMFHLQPRVHFNEIEAAIFVEEFNRAGAQIAQSFQGAGADAADLVALLGVEGGAARFLPHFLVAALQRTIPLAQMHDMAMAVGQNLDLDME